MKGSKEDCTDCGGARYNNDTHDLLCRHCEPKHEFNREIDDRRRAIEEARLDLNEGKHGHQAALVRILDMLEEDNDRRYNRGP